ncbi:MAG: family 1 encapsulin nanocompartment shell protein [Tissierellia bacterium]|nr:family 1 encapsulin nanocompartment shell protein [Tissierellia bacterium]
MNKNAAPISQDAWQEINDTAKEALTNFLSARKSLNVEGPRGKAFGVINEGKLEDIKEKDGVCFANYDVKPLTEIRIEFDLDRFELDNIERGSEDPELDNLEEACEKIALFEENAIYNGLKEAEISGIKESSEHEAIEFGESANDIRKAIALGVSELKESYAHSPFDLIVSKDVLTKIHAAESPYPLYEAIEKIIGGKIILSRAIDGAILLPHDDEDIRLVIGEDFTIGYQDSDNKKVIFYITESFTTRILDEAKIVVYR